MIKFIQVVFPAPGTFHENAIINNLKEIVNEMSIGISFSVANSDLPKICLSASKNLQNLHLQKCALLLHFYVTIFSKMKIMLRNIFKNHFDFAKKLSQKNAI